MFTRLDVAVDDAVAMEVGEGGRKLVAELERRGPRWPEVPFVKEGVEGAVGLQREDEGVVGRIGVGPENGDDVWVVELREQRKLLVEAVHVCETCDLRALDGDWDPVHQSMVDDAASTPAKLPVHLPLGYRKKCQSCTD